jgi:hypothetical protein
MHLWHPWAATDLARASRPETLSDLPAGIKVSID